MIREKKRGSFLFHSPTKTICLSFALVILVGTLLLMLPISARNGQATEPVTALFTATTATCVTGLVMVDTFLHWSLFGQTVILLLIQIGGLGLVTFASFFGVVIHKKLRLKSLQLAMESISATSISDVRRLVKFVIRTVFGVELIGALALSFTFVPSLGFWEGLYTSVFLAVSAFCNAGLDILNKVVPCSSLTEFSSNPAVLIPIMLLIIFGGLGFLVWSDLFSFHKTRKMSFYSKLVLVMTATLIVAGTFGILTMEWSNPATLGGMPFGQKLLNSMFQSVSCRTAGFESIANASMTSGGKIVSIILMFIGAAPSSTGGGIKVVTFAVLIMTVASVFRGRDETVIAHRLVPQRTVYKSLAIMVSGAMVVILTSMVINYTNPAANIGIVDSVFESVSAFATVGLTSGVSGTVNVISHLALIMTMFIGRVGPVSFALTLAMRGGHRGDSEVLPTANLLVG